MRTREHIFVLAAFALDSYWTANQFAATFWHRLQFNHLVFLHHNTTTFYAPRVWFRSFSAPSFSAIFLPHAD
jgi:hypothetical protein